MAMATNHVMTCLFASFREVVEGSETLKKIENLATVNDRPELACKIDDCGVFEYHFWHNMHLTHLRTVLFFHVKNKQLP